MLSQSLDLYSAPPPAYADIERERTETALGLAATKLASNFLTELDRIPHDPSSRAEIAKSLLERMTQSLQVAIPMLSGPSTECSAVSNSEASLVADLDWSLWESIIYEQSSNSKCMLFNDLGRSIKTKLILLIEDGISKENFGRMVPVLRDIGVYPSEIDRAEGSFLPISDRMSSSGYSLRTILEGGLKFGYLDPTTVRKAYDLGLGLLN